jgi:hypothetical protein
MSNTCMQPRQCFNAMVYFAFIEQEHMDMADFSALSEGKEVDLDESTGPCDSASIVALPIEAHRDEILARVQRDRVVIIHGETGCGKSSRIPAMLLEDALTKGEVSRFLCHHLVAVRVNMCVLCGVCSRARCLCPSRAASQRAVSCADCGRRSAVRSACAWATACATRRQTPKYGSSQLVSRT